jgi:hypothetical protein
MELVTPVNTARGMQRPELLQAVLDETMGWAVISSSGAGQVKVKQM